MFRMMLKFEFLDVKNAKETRLSRFQQLVRGADQFEKDERKNSKWKTKGEKQGKC